jgi:hypothetical protein
VLASKTRQEASERWLHQTTRGHAKKCSNIHTTSSNRVSGVTLHVRVVGQHITALKGHTHALDDCDAQAALQQQLPRVQHDCEQHGRHQDALKRYLANVGCARDLNALYGCHSSRSTSPSGMTDRHPKAEAHGCGGPWTATDSGTKAKAQPPTVPLRSSNVSAIPTMMCMVLDNTFLCIDATCGEFNRQSRSQHTRPHVEELRREGRGQSRTRPKSSCNGQIWATTEGSMAQMGVSRGVWGVVSTFWQVIPVGFTSKSRAERLSLSRTPRKRGCAAGV